MPNTRAPRVDILELKADYVKFILSETDTSVANALRRTLIAEVPTMAIDLVTIIENETSLQDEFLAHRLGLIPLRVDPDVKFVDAMDCDCDDNCENCSSIFTLDVSYDDKVAKMNDAQKNLPVFITSIDLISSDPRVVPVHFASSDEADNVCDEGVMIAKITKGQRIKLSAIARMGIGKEHAKWSPVSVATYQFDPIILVNEEKMQLLRLNEKEAIVESCPTKVFGIDKAKNLKVTKRLNCMYCDECKVVADQLKQEDEEDPILIVKPSADRFIFSVETNGSLDAETVVTTALDILSSKLQSLKGLFGNLKQL